MKTKYRIIEERDIMRAQVLRWWLPFWDDLKGYRALYGNRENALRWCREAIENHKAGRPLDPPEWKVIE